MSVLLSIYDSSCFSSTYSKHEALQVRRFWDFQKYGMVLPLGPVLQDTKISVHIAGGLGNNFKKVSRAHVVGTRAGHQDPAGPEHLQSPQVEFFVTAQCRFQIALALGEGWGVEDDGVVLLAGAGVVAKQVEGVGFDPFDFAPVQSRVPVGDFKRRSRAIQSRNFRAALGQM